MHYNKNQERWKNYKSYQLVVLTSMINEISVVFAVTKISHSAFYVHGSFFILSNIFVGIPLAYSIICITQYTNSDVLSTWDFFPLFRGFGAGTIFIMLLKNIHTTIIISWYMIYIFHAADRLPPWFTCNDFNDTRCVVKRGDLSIFQHCIETMRIFKKDCDLVTASSFFFTREIGHHCTRTSFIKFSFFNINTCFFVWKPLLAAFCVHGIVFVCNITKAKSVVLVAKTLLGFIVLEICVLVVVALTTNGGLALLKPVINWRFYTYPTSVESCRYGFLMVGTGSGMLTYLTGDISFRSSAAKTAVITSLLATIFTILLSLIIYIAIKAMCYYHLDNNNILEIGSSYLFNSFGSITEVLSYFHENSIWGFMWFLLIFLCLLNHLIIAHQFLNDFLMERIQFTRTYRNTSCIFVSITILLISRIFQCCDLTASLTDALEIMQLVGSFSFALSLYWIYGYEKHSVDIIFMVGIKTSCYWRILWFINPMIIAIYIHAKFNSMYTKNFHDSHVIESMSLASNILFVYILLGIYFIIVLIGMTKEIIAFYRSKNISKILVACDNWGPRDYVLLKSRRIFLPEVMTYDFLYRQLEIQRYKLRQKYTNTSICKLERDSIR